MTDRIPSQRGARDVTTPIKLITWKYDSDLYRIQISSELLMKIIVVSRTESSVEILSIGIYSICFIGINRFIPHTVTVGLQMIISAHCHQITFESKVGDSLSLAPGSTPDVRHSSLSPHPGGFFLAFTPTPPSSITFLMTSHCVLQQRLNHKNTKETFSGCEELKKFERGFV